MPIASCAPSPGLAPLSWPVLLGGMGVAISDWRLAKAVASRGMLGMVSGTGLDTVFVRRLQDGDEGGHLRRAMDRFPVAGTAGDALKRWFRAGGRPPGMPYALLPLDGTGLNPDRLRLIALASFCEVTLAKEGHGGAVGMNLLTKIAMPNLASLWGAMLAGVDVIAMGAGIPREIPAALDALASGREAKLRMEVLGLPAEEAPFFRLDPAALASGAPLQLRRPAFLAIVSSNLLASVLVRKSSGRVDGLIIERPIAGGHNAPPRDDTRRNERGEPVYGERDEIDLARIAALGVPFWLAGGAASPESLAAARAAGATGIQAGTIFAFCRESGLDPRLRAGALRLAREGRLEVVTDPLASPTGFPFKVVQAPGTLSDVAVAAARLRACDLGYLRLAYRRDDGRIGFRCPAEPGEVYASKGGAPVEIEGRKCLCNALMANAGLGQLLAEGGRELPLLTAGDDVEAVRRMLGDREDYSAGDVIDQLLG